MVCKFILIALHCKKCSLITQLLNTVTKCTCTYSTMTLNITGTNSAIFYIYSTVGSTSGFIYLDVVHSTRKQHAYLRFSERTPST